MKYLKKDLFRIFLIVLLCIPMMAKAAPATSSESTNILYADKSEDLTKEDYETRNKAVCVICITLDILIVISIVALVVKLYKLKQEKEENDELKKKKKSVK